MNKPAEAVARSVTNVIPRSHRRGSRSKGIHRLPSVLTSSLDELGLAGP